MKHIEMTRIPHATDFLAYRNRCRRNPTAAFTLLEVILVILILSLAAALVLPAVASRLGHLDEQRRLVRLVSEVRHLRDMAFSLRVPARVMVDEEAFLLFLDGRELKRIPLGPDKSREGEIHLNRFGFTVGGSLHLEMDRKWTVSLAPGSGRVSLERSP